MFIVSSIFYRGFNDCGMDEILKTFFLNTPYMPIVQGRFCTYYPLATLPNRKSCIESWI